jgi:hypothetical protein
MTLSIAVFAGVMAPATALASSPLDPKIQSFSVSPSCAHPGGTVTADAVFGPSTGGIGTYYVFAQLRVFYFGRLIADAPQDWPYQTGGEVAWARSTWQANVPWYAPWGPYTVVFSIGPSKQDMVSYDSRSMTVTVSPVFC